MSTPSRIAFHEAGHAAIGLHFWPQGLAYARISTDGTGHVHYIENLRLVDPDEWVVTLLAGRAAERFVGRECNPDVLDARAAIDLQMANAWLQAFHDTAAAADAAFQHAERVVVFLVLKYERFIRVIADQLEAKRMLGSRDLRALVEQYADEEMTRCA